MIEVDDRAQTRASERPSWYVSRGSSSSSSSGTYTKSSHGLLAHNQQSKLPDHQHEGRGLAAAVALAHPSSKGNAIVASLECRLGLACTTHDQHRSANYPRRVHRHIHTRAHPREHVRFSFSLKLVLSTIAPLSLSLSRAAMAHATTRQYSVPPLATSLVHGLYHRDAPSPLSPLDSTRLDLQRVRQWWCKRANERNRRASKATRDEPSRAKMRKNAPPGEPND